MWKNTSYSYGLIARIFHWTMSIIILTMLLVGFIMDGMEPSGQKWQLYALHKATGVIVLILAILRLIWRLLNSKVLLPDDLPDWQKRAAGFTHILLYIMMFAMPVSGILMSTLGGHDISVYGIFTIKAITKQPPIASVFYQIHIKSAFFLCGLLCLHITAALYHHFIRKDNVLMRMLKPSNE